MHPPPPNTPLTSTVTRNIKPGITVYLHNENIPDLGYPTTKTSFSVMSSISSFSILLVNISEGNMIPLWITSSGSLYSSCDVVEAAIAAGVVLTLVGGYIAKLRL